ncbi:MAG: hypothetical protein KKB70_04015 [Proteobacteria bacterium]|nr:hypothetical protein [Pseudomonadota bacterium]MBU1611096.1 hypothetical protein [Pseudomonadota bacterium]
MKVYFVMLAVLFLFSIINRIMSLIIGAPSVIMVSYLADMVLFGLCLRVAYGVAFNKRYFEPSAVRLIYYGVMALGLLSVFLVTAGELVGLPDLEIHALDLILWFLPYPLFALPCVLLERALKEDEDLSKG